MRTIRGLFAASCITVALLVVGAGCGDENRPETVVEPETKLHDPDVLFELEGTYVAPDSNQFLVKAFRRFLSGEVVTKERQAIVIGERGWVQTDGGWNPLDDPDVQDDLGSSPGSREFWIDFLDTSKLKGLDRRAERVNGIDAQEFATTDGEVIAQAFGAPTARERWTSIDEFTVWLADDGGWPVAMRLVVRSEDYPFESSSDSDDRDSEVAYDLPPDALDSYRYASIIATERSDGATEQEYRTEIMVAIWDINDSDAKIQPPEVSRR